MTGLSLLSQSETSNPLHDDACIHGYPIFPSGGLLRVRTGQLSGKGTDQGRRQSTACRLSSGRFAVRSILKAGTRRNTSPYVGLVGASGSPGERYSARTMTKRQADALLRKDLRKFCAMFRKFGRDSLLLATLAYNVGPYRLLGSGKIPKSTLIRNWRRADRNIYREYIAFCNYKGKRHAMLLKRRKAEFALYIWYTTEIPCGKQYRKEF